MIVSTSAKGLHRSASEIACNKILANEGSPEILSRYQQLFSNTIDLDERQFTTLHRIVLRLDGRDLQTYFRLCSRTEINQTDNRGLPALQWAAHRNDSDMVLQLLRETADPNVMTKGSNSALHIAALKGKAETVDSLLRYGADVNALNDLNYTALLYMHARSHPAPNLASARRLLAAGADINAQEEQGGTALGFSIQHGFLTSVQTLIEYGADINLANKFGETPVTIAVQANFHAAIPLLLANGANF